MIKVLLADDQLLFRQGLRALLELSGEVLVLAEAVDGADAIEKASCSKPDVILLDVRLPKASGPQVIAELRRRGRLVPTLLMSTFDDDQAIVDGIRAGAAGFVLKGIDFDHFLNVVRTIAKGGRYYYDGGHDRVVQALTAAGDGLKAEYLPVSLTPREIDVLRLLSCGLSNREIADALNLAEGTTKNYVSDLLSKLGVRDRMKAVLKALQHGLI